MDEGINSEQFEVATGVVADCNALHRSPTPNLGELGSRRIAIDIKLHFPNEVGIRIDAEERQISCSIASGGHKSQLGSRRDLIRTSGRISACIKLLAENLVGGGTSEEVLL